MPDNKTLDIEWNDIIDGHSRYTGSRRTGWQAEMTAGGSGYCAGVHNKLLKLKSWKILNFFDGIAGGLKI